MSVIETIPIRFFFESTTGRRFILLSFIIFNAPSIVSSGEMLIMFFHVIDEIFACLPKFFNKSLSVIIPRALPFWTKRRLPISFSLISLAASNRDMSLSTM